MCVTPRPVQSYRCILYRDKFHLNEHFVVGIIWSDTQEEAHVRARKPTDSVKQAQPGHQEAQWSSDTCDDDLGDIQNGAE